MNYAKKHSGLLKGALLALLAFVIIASPLSIRTAHPVFNTVSAATPSCPTSVQTLQVNSDGSWDCITQGGDLTGNIADHYNANGTRPAQASDVTNPTTGTTQKLDANGQVISEPTSCNGIWNFWTSPIICIGRSISAFIAGSLVFITSSLLAIAGLLFDWLVNNTIIHFGDAVYTTSVKTAVETAWTAFRDIANIVIIGIFTFIAISIILGLKEFGQKKLIANVLIIAVLINFSLLFTKMIVDASNFTALQVYSASNGQTLSASSDTGQSQSYDIAGAFMRYAGVSGFTDTFSATRQLADNLDNGFVALLHGIFTATLLLGAAIVLFYGSFLLISRTLLIIFLMITASIAFASYLVPAWETSSYGWKTWWNSLLKSAVLAPVLMFFLWATLAIAAALKPAGGTLGDLATNPTSTPDMAALFNYIIILGLLFISFKLSSTFAGKIAGFNFASLVPALGVGLGARFAGVLGRQFIGRPALNISERLQGRSKAAESAFARRLYDFGAQGFKGVAKRDFNAMRTPFGTAIQQTAGIKKLDTLAGKELKGFEGTQKEFLKRTGEAARRMEYSKEDQDEIKAKGFDRALRKNADLAQRFAEAEKAHGENTSNRDQLRRDEAGMKEEFAGIMRNLQTTLANEQRALTVNPADGGARSRAREAEEAITRERERQTRELREHESRIKEASRAAKQSGEIFENVKKNVHETAVAAGYVPKEFKKAGDIAKDIVRGSFTATLFRASGLSDRSNEKLAKKAVIEAGKQKRQQRVRDEFMPALKDFAQEGEPHAPAAPAASATPGAEEGH